MVIGLLLSSCGDDPQTLLTKARQAYAAHDFKAAQINLANVLKAQPGELLRQAQDALPQDAEIAVLRERLSG